MAERSVRDRRPVPTPRRDNPFARSCPSCGADFLTVEGGSAERGIWRGWRWYCSKECDPQPMISEDDR